MWYLYESCFHFLTISITTVKLIVIFLLIMKILQVLTRGRCKSMKCLVGKTAIVTGGSSGMGFETALVLASRGCRVIIADKNTSDKPKIEIITRTSNPNVEIKYLDLSSLKSVRQFAKEINETEERLDILINNAGIGAIGNKYTEDGLHSTMQTNHFGPFLLTHLLVDILKRSAPSRVIFVSSMLAFTANLNEENLNYAEDHPYTFLEICSIYANSKLCNIISSNGFAKRLQQYGIAVNSLHPGAVNTDMYVTFVPTRKYGRIVRTLKRWFIGFVGKTPEEGTQTTLHLAMADEVEGITGKHFWDCKVFAMPPKAKNARFCNEIWRRSEELVGLKENEFLI